MCTGQVHGGFLILYGNRLLHVAEFFKGINYCVFANRTQAKKMILCDFQVMVVKRSIMKSPRTRIFLC